MTDGTSNAAEVIEIEAATSAPTLICNVPKCGREIPEDKARVRGVLEIRTTLGRTPRVRDLAGEVVCGACGYTARNQGVYTYPYAAVRDLLAKQEADEAARSEKKVAVAVFFNRQRAERREGIRVERRRPHQR